MTSNFFSTLKHMNLPSTHLRYFLITTRQPVLLVHTLAHLFGFVVFLL